MTVKEGEVFMIEAMGTYSGYQTFFIEYSTDKTNWTKSATAITLGSDWATYSVSDIPAGNITLLSMLRRLAFATSMAANTIILPLQSSQ